MSGSKGGDSADAEGETETAAPAKFALSSLVGMNGDEVRQTTIFKLLRRWLLFFFCFCVHIYIRLFVFSHAVDFNGPLYLLPYFL